MTYKPKHYISTARKTRLSKNVYCPVCKKHLIRLEPTVNDVDYMYWCDDCNIDIQITDNKAKENEEKW